MFKIFPHFAECLGSEVNCDYIGNIYLILKCIYYEVHILYFCCIEQHGIIWNIWFESTHTFRDVFALFVRVMFWQWQGQERDGSWSVLVLLTADVKREYRTPISSTASSGSQYSSSSHTLAELIWSPCRQEKNSSSPSERKYSDFTDNLKKKKNCIFFK